MKPPAIFSPGSYLGHVKDGVIVLDTHSPFTEGQAVRIEPVAADAQHPDEQAEQLRKMECLFAQWDEEDRTENEQPNR